MQSIKIAFLLLACTALAMAGSAKSTFHGEISDSQCAMNVHSLNRTHQEMIKKNTLGSDAASCARACARRGGEWVLRSGDEIYRLKNQTAIEEYAGQKVIVSGSLDTKTNTIDNVGIKPEPLKGPASQ
jgi:hypothetical protein